jgi:hypothetical protein
MDSILKNIKYDKQYCEDIIESKYIQTITISNENVFKEDNNQMICNKTSMPVLNEYIISNIDHAYYLSSDKNVYYKKKLIEICEDVINNQASYNYGKKMNSCLIQRGFESSDVTLSSIAVIQDYFKISIILVFNDVHYRLFNKYNKCITIQWNGHNWSEYTNDSHINSESIQYESFDKFPKMNNDIKIVDINKKILKNISKYKVSELIDIAKQYDIPIVDKGKKKTKLILYNEIEHYIINNNIKNILM